MCSVVDLCSINRLTVVALMGRVGAYAGVAMLVHVPVDECQEPATSFLDVWEGGPGVVRPAFHDPQQRLHEGVLVADPRP